MSRNLNEAQQDLSRRRDLPRKGGIYEHYKGGLYVVTEIGLFETTGDIMVSYKSNRTGDVWVRTLSNFEEHVSDEDLLTAGIISEVPVPRFRRVDR